MTCTVSAALRLAEKKLVELDTARLDAELLLAKVLVKSRSFILAYADTLLTDVQNSHYQTLIEQRVRKVPLAYLLAEKEFWSLCFTVTPEVLIPRPETELLVELILRDYSSYTTLTLIDLGTGSGAIAVALSKERPRWQIVASDFSQAALDIAKNNAARLLESTECISFIHSDWLTNFSKDPQADVIISNPPYLAEEDVHLINSEISYEPKSALIAKDDGLAEYKKIAQQAKAYLKPIGRLYFEHGANQAEQVADILSQAGFVDIKNYCDLAGLPRVTRAVKG